MLLGSIQTIGVALLQTYYLIITMTLYLSYLVF